MTRHARKATPPPEAESTVPGPRVLVVNEQAPDAPAPPSASVPAPAPAANAPAVRRKRRSRFVF